MKFENIKKDDIVFTQTSIRYSFSSSKSFFTPKRVIRVTKTQFVLEDDSRWKKDGRGIDRHKYLRAFNEGEKTGYGNSTIVEDQRAEMKEFKEKIQVGGKIVEILSSRKRPSINRRFEDLKSALSHLEKALELIESDPVTV